jgi:hypothetical protein
VRCSIAERKDSLREKAKTNYLDKTTEKFGFRPVDILVRINRKKLRKWGLDTASVYDPLAWVAIKTCSPRECAKLALK